MAVHSETSIASWALSKLGSARVASISQDSKGAEAMNFRFPYVRDAMLQAYPWRFAMVRTTLAADATAPEWGYARRFLLPSDCLQFRALGDDIASIQEIGVTVRGLGFGTIGTGAVCEVIGQYIHTDLSAPLKIEYIRQVTDVGEFPDVFAEAMACKLATDAAIELPNSTTLQRDLAAEYARTISDARNTDAILRPPERRAPGAWVTARLGI